jgi:hypothetical protein
MATANEVGQKVEREVDAALREIEQAADEIRVKVHLAGMDAKDAWRKLEPKLDAAKAHAKTASKDTLSALDEVKKAFNNFAASLKH